MKPFRLTTALLGFLSAVFTAPFAVQAAEEIKLEATATWESSGSLYLVGEQQAMFVGGLNGVMFVHDGSGTLNAASISCPGMIDIDLETGLAAGSGRCIVTGVAGDRVFAQWNCVGIAMVGCEGNFVLIGGTGRFQGVTGGGPMILRSALGSLTADLASGDVRSIGLGLAVWPDLTLKLP